MRAILLMPMAVLVMAGEGPGLAEMADTLYPYEPTYFALDPGFSDAPLNAKFQFSVALRVLGRGEDQDGLRPVGLYASYSQTSFWDLQSESKPFYDNSYRPELWWHQSIPASMLGGRLGIEPGLAHESNGKSGSDSRSINCAVLRLLGSWQQGDVQITATPRFRYYLDKVDNPDIDVYRGYVDLIGAIRRPGSWEVSVTGRIGSEWDRGSLMLEGSHPLNTWTDGLLHGYLYAQAFTGWGETLQSYDQKSPQPRVLIGFALIR